MVDESPGVRRGEWAWAVAATVCVVALASLPYIVVYFATPPDLRFVGVLINPLDGDSYFAKMQIGARGGWLFHLLYTAQAHPGALLFAFHILLGHVAAWTGLPIPVVYHLARVMAGCAMLLVVYVFIARVTQDLAKRRIAFLLVALSSGLGWLAAVFGYLESSDLVIPESNTFYSLHINPHFPLATALMIVVMIFVVRGLRSAASGLQVAICAAASLALAIVQPFAVVPLYITLAVYQLLFWRRDGRIAWQSVWTAVIAGAVTLPVTAYTFWVTQADPVLRGWTAQNVTPSPPVWDYVLGYGVILVLAMPGAIEAARRKSDIDLLLLAWVGVTLLLLYAPFALQRRFSLGLHVPLAILAAMGLGRAAGGRKLATGAVLAATLPTTVLVVILALGGGLQHNPRLFVSADEAAALDWLREHAPPDAVVLASPEMGLFVPAWSGSRVVYGHPFETVDAERTKSRVEIFFAAGTSDADRAAMLSEWNVSFVLAGPRERGLGLASSPPGTVVFTSPTVTLVQR